MTAVASDVWLPLKAIAARDGVSRQAISKQVARLIEQHSLEVQRDGRGRVGAINIVHYDDLRRRFGDSAKIREVDPGPSISDPSEDATLDGARRIKLVHETVLIRLRLKEESGDLVRMDSLTAATDRLVEEFIRIVDLLQHADQIAAAVQRGGLHELRILLKRLNHETRAAIAESFTALARSAPATDEGLAQEGEDQA